MCWYHSISRFCDALGSVAAWLFFATGLMLSYEVVARYFFNAPTVWAAEIAQLFLIWGTFLSMARVLRRGQHIRIEVLTAALGETPQRYLRVFSLSVIALFSLWVIGYGWEIAHDSLERGRSTGTMLNIPNWWSQMIIPAGFSLLLLQSLAELLRLVTTRYDGSAN